MIDVIKLFFSYGFITRALIVGVLTAVCASLLGVSLVLKRYSMIGDGLSHVGFGALAVAVALNFTPLAVSLPVVLITAVLLLRLDDNNILKGDAAIALVSTGALAVGVMIISMSKGMNSDVNSYMFGTILSIKNTDLILSVITTITVFVLYIIFYNKIFTVTFDEGFARAKGIKTKYYNMLIAILTASVIVVGMHIMGAMLISGLIIFPALSSMRVFKSYRGVVISSAVLSVICFVGGIVLSVACDTPAGASVIVVNLAVFAICYVIGMKR